MPDIANLNNTPSTTDTARHESGHAVVGILLGFPPPSVTIVPGQLTANAIIAGEAIFDSSATVAYLSGLEPSRALFQMLVRTWAGPAAPAVLRGEQQIPVNLMPFDIFRKGDKLYTTDEQFASLQAPVLASFLGLRPDRADDVSARSMSAAVAILQLPSVRKLANSLTDAIIDKKELTSADIAVIVNGCISESDAVQVTRIIDEALDALTPKWGPPGVRNSLRR